MTIQNENGADSIRCLKCNAALAVTGHGCPACGYTLEGVRLYNPTHFLLLAFLLSAMVPIFLAASNWGRIGDRARKRRWLSIGFAGFVALFTTLILLPDFGNPAAMLVGYVVNLPIGWIIRDVQRPVYVTALALGAKPASSFMGSIKGFGVTILALAIPAVGYNAYMTAQENRALELLEQGRCAEAAVAFEHILSWNLDDEYTRFNLALCHFCLERWADATKGFRAYLKRHADDPDAHAFLGYALQEQGKQDEADRHFATAERLDPDVLTRLFGPEYR